MTEQYYSDKKKVHFGSLDKNKIGRSMCKVILSPNGPYHFTTDIGKVSCCNCLNAIAKHKHHDPEMMRQLSILATTMRKSNRFDEANLLKKVYQHIEALEVLAGIENTIKHIQDEVAKVDTVVANEFDADLIRKIRSVVVQHLCVPSEKVTPTARLDSDLGADSLDLIEIVMMIEEEFELEIPDDEAENWETMSDVYRCVQKSIENKPAKKGK